MKTLPHFSITNEELKELGVGYIKKIGYNDNWQEQELYCPYEHCIELMPLEENRENGCPTFGHNCPDTTMLTTCRTESEEEHKKELERELATLNTTSGFTDWEWEPKKSTFRSPLFSMLANIHGFPDTWVVGNLIEEDALTATMFYYAGHWCGKHKDLLCVISSHLQETSELEPFLSPEGKSPHDAINKAVALHKSLQQRHGLFTY